MSFFLYNSMYVFIQNDDHLYLTCITVVPGVNFMSKKLGVKIPPGGISPNLIKNFPFAFLLEDRFLLKLGEIYSKL